MIKILTTLLLAAMLWSSYAQAEKVLPVSLAEVKRATQPSVAWFNASVISRQHINISAEISGRINWVAEFGKQLKSGELLASIDDRDLQLKLKLQQQILNRAEQIRSYRLQELKRLQSMKQVQGVSQTQLDLARHDFQIAEIDLQEQKIVLQSIQQDITKASSYAPFDGVINTQHLKPGEYVQVGDKLVTLVNKNAPEIRLFIPIEQIKELTNMQPLQLRHADLQSTGKMAARAYSADEKSRLVEMRITPDEPGLWTIGEALQVAIPKNNASDALEIPRDALVVDQQGKAIFRVDEANKVKRIPVQVVNGRQDTVSVVGELAAGDRVIVRGSGMLKTGDTVNPI